uniref:Uncharacterized protein n=1 Tax=viral metagenome TaxID=1070528 RepID=A0A6C0JSV8_9ZZZZ
MSSQNVCDELTSFNELSKEWEECKCYPIECRISSSFSFEEIWITSTEFLDPMIFALEYNEKGNRMFFVTSWKHFPHYFIRMRNHFDSDKTMKTWHEIFSPGRSFRLYLDLEDVMTKYYKRDYEKDIIELTEHLKKEAKSFARSRQRHAAQTKGYSFVRVIELDSTRGIKFSKHLIVHGIEFKSMKECKKFVLNLPKNFLSIIDTSVYSESCQNFRMFGSPKFMMDNTLVRISEDSDHYKGFHINCDVCTQNLLDSLANFSQEVPTSLSFENNPFNMIKNEIVKYFCGSGILLRCLSNNIQMRSVFEKDFKKCLTNIEQFNLEFIISLEVYINPKTNCHLKQHMLSKAIQRFIRDNLPKEIEQEKNEISKKDRKMIRKVEDNLASASNKIVIGYYLPQILIENLRSCVSAERHTGFQFCMGITRETILEKIKELHWDKDSEIKRRIERDRIKVERKSIKDKKILDYCDKAKELLQLEELDNEIREIIIEQVETVRLLTIYF